MESKAASTGLSTRQPIGLFPFILLYALLAALQGLFPLLAFGPSHYGALSLRLSGWALLMQLAAPLLFGGLTLAALLWLWGRRNEPAEGMKKALAVHGTGNIIFLVLAAITSLYTIYPDSHIGYGLSGAPYATGMALSLLWQAAVATGFAAVPVYAILPRLQQSMKPGAAAWAAFGIVLLVQSLAMAAFRQLWQWMAKPANLLLLDILPNAIAPVIIGMVPVMLAILVCQRTRKGGIWPAVFAVSASHAVWAALGPQLGAVLAGMGMGDSTYLILVHLVLAVLMLLVFAVMSLTIGRKLKKRMKRLESK